MGNNCQANNKNKKIIIVQLPQKEMPILKCLKNNQLYKNRVSEKLKRKSACELSNINEGSLDFLEETPKIYEKIMSMTQLTNDFKTFRQLNKDFY